MELYGAIIRQYYIDMDYKFPDKDLDYAIDVVTKARQFWTPSSG